jgi:3-deoxy-7-phosphoheptulonate synthase
MEEDRLKLMAAAKKVLGLLIVTEVMNLFEIDLVAKYSDVIQVGKHNIRNFSLLKKRGMMNTIQEFLVSSNIFFSSSSPTPSRPRQEIFST